MKWNINLVTLISETKAYSLTPGFLFLKYTPSQAFSCQFYEIFENTFFGEHFWELLLNKTDGQKI